MVEHNQLEYALARKETVRGLMRFSPPDDHAGRISLENELKRIAKEIKELKENNG